MSDRTAAPTAISSPSRSAAVDQIFVDYQRLEPGETDAWNPVRSNFELVHRLCLLHAATTALRLAPVPIHELSVLDLGCGNGRSTRMYLDLGLRPEQLNGLDVRPGAIELARKLNRSIRFEVYGGQEIPFADETFTWTQLSTVVSSIKEPRHRREIVDQIRRKTRPGGCVFYFDLVRANDFAGHDIIHPERLFAGFKVLRRHGYDGWRFMQELDTRSVNFWYLNYSRLKTFLLPVKPTFETLLMAKLD
jgi:SAM-dependent methyltransferase